MLIFTAFLDRKNTAGHSEKVCFTLCTIHYVTYLTCIGDYFLGLRDQIELIVSLCV